MININDFRLREILKEAIICKKKYGLFDASRVDLYFYSTEQAMVAQGIIEEVYGVKPKVLAASPAPPDIPTVQVPDSLRKVFLGKYKDACIAYREIKYKKGKTYHHYEDQYMEIRRLLTDHHKGREIE